MKAITSEQMKIPPPYSIPILYEIPPGLLLATKDAIMSPEPFANDINVTTAIYSDILKWCTIFMIPGHKYSSIIDVMNLKIKNIIMIVKGIKTNNDPK